MGVTQLAIRWSLVLAGLLLFGSQVEAQDLTAYTRDFQQGKQFLKEERYNLAMETFKKLLPYDDENPYYIYASFYYAVAASKQGYSALARDQFKEILKLYPDWDKNDEVRYWLAYLLVEEKQYANAYELLNSLRNRELLLLADKLRETAAFSITDLHLLEELHQKYPADKALARALAGQWRLDPSKRLMLEKLVREYQLKSDLYLPKTGVQVRETFVFSLVFPYVTSALEPIPGRKRNQPLLDYYDGARLAADSLQQLGMKVELRPYDTDRNPEKLGSLLRSGELLNSDLIAGPFFQEEALQLNKYATEHQLPTLNYFLGSSTFPEPVLNLSPAPELAGETAMQFMLPKLKKKTVVVIYGNSSRDSLMALSFANSIKKHNVRVLKMLRVTRSNPTAITSYLATPTEYDEFRYASQFTLKKDSVGAILAATDDPTLFAKILGAVETRKDNIPVLGLESWLDQTLIDLEKFQTLPVFLMAVNSRFANETAYTQFVNTYARRYGRVPTIHAIWGFESVWLGHTAFRQSAGHLLGWLRQQPLTGNLTSGWDFTRNNSNSRIVFIGYQNGKFRIVE